MKKGVKEIFSGCKRHFLQVATTYLRTVKKAHFDQSLAWAPLSTLFKELTYGDETVLACGSS